MVLLRGTPLTEKKGDRNNHIGIFFLSSLYTVCLICLIVLLSIKKWMKTIFGSGYGASCSAHGTVLWWICLEPHKAQQVPLYFTMSFGASTQVHILREKKNQDPKQHGSRGADGRGGWRAERPAGISWRGDGDRHARYQALFASLGSQQGVKTKVCIQRGILLFCAKYSWMWAAPNSRHIFGRKTAFLGIWQSWWLTAVGALIIHSLCWFSF